MWFLGSTVEKCCVYFLLQTSSSGSSGQEQNETSNDATAKKRRRREADDNQKESSTKVKREAEPAKAEKLQTELVRRSQDQNINTPSYCLTFHLLLGLRI